ncbi:MAG: hypothetical protein OJF50_002714 [Nitrospira sp.]|jgi:hypothetical protein|nr:hypothetical protein [Nitrospira sp.]
MEAPTSHHSRQAGRSNQRSRKLEQEDTTFLVPNSLLVADTITLLKASTAWARSFLLNGLMSRPTF